MAVVDIDGCYTRHNVFRGPATGITITEPCSPQQQHVNQSHTLATSSVLDKGKQKVVTAIEINNDLQCIEGVACTRVFQTDDFCTRVLILR